MNILKSIPILYVLLIPFFFVGCSPPVVEEVSTEVTEDVIRGIEDTRSLYE